MAPQPAKFPISIHIFYKWRTVRREWTETGLHSDATTIFNEKFHIYRKFVPPFPPPTPQFTKGLEMRFFFVFFLNIPSSSSLNEWLSVLKCLKVFRLFLKKGQKTSNQHGGTVCLYITFTICRFRLHRLRDQFFLLTRCTSFTERISEASPGQEKASSFFSFFVILFQLWSTASHSVRNTKQILASHKTTSIRDSSMWLTGKIYCGLILTCLFI